MNRLPEPNDQGVTGDQSQVETNPWMPDYAPEDNTPDQGESEDVEQTPETNTLAETPRIWIGSLSDYNNGVLHGEWIDATQDADEVYEQIAEMLTASPTTAEHGDLAEEYAIFDHDNFCGLQIDEYDSITEVTRLARLIEVHGEAFAAWAEHVGRDVATADDAGEKFLGSYVGCYRRKEDYAEGLLDDLGVTAELDEVANPILSGYVNINYGMLAQDLELDGSVTFVETPNGWWWAFRE